MVVVLPEVADDGDALAGQMDAVVAALDIPEARPGRLIVTIGESADAVLRAAEPQTARCSSCRRRIWRVGLDGAWRSEDGFGCPATGKAHRPAAPG